MNENNILKFLLEQQNNINSIFYKNQNVFDLREKCEHHLSLKKRNHLFSNYFKNIKETDEIKIINNYIFDKNYLNLIDSKEKAPIESNLECIFGLFTSQLCKKWQEHLILKGDNYFAIRTGFFSNELDIYDSILNNFDGIALFVSGKDSYQIQYLTEIGRDFSFPIIFIAQNKQEVLSILNTDAPYFAIFGFEQENLSPNLKQVLSLYNLFPKTTYPIAFTNNVNKEKVTVLKNLGYKLNFQFKFIDF